MKNKQIMVKKVPVEFLLECLLDLDEAGIQYVDIVTKKKKKGNWIGIAVNENYSLSEGPIIQKFNGKNINDLIV
jgi:hypothetical protein